ncbi:unnamed protein product [Diatraea saccharalis]|uniref:FP protein C-terminal domain-containing protein n=1 Tax=Diatraea saccharalis TaxID=40085 RepID=A0A9N9R948_9NEOP|nr:unnamed protein product [Diatraea saccharalis]
MSNVKKVCTGCQIAIEDRRYFLCGKCGQYYDLICANVSEQRFYNTMTKEHKNAWRCVLCISKQPKFDNTNTPVRAVIDAVTVQRGAAVTSPMQLDMSVVENPQSVMDTTIETYHNMTIEMTEFQSFVLEMRAFREEIREEMRANRLESKRLNDSVAALADRITECESHMKKLDERVEQLEVRLSDKRDGTSTLSAAIDQLKSELNERDQEFLLTDIEITCIPEQKEENLLTIVNKVATKLGVTLHAEDVVSAVRMGRILDVTRSPATSRPRPIVVRLARRAMRDRFLDAVKVRRGANTEDMNLPGRPCRFFVNERLTKRNRQLFRRARELARDLGWRYVWTKDGRIFARHRSGSDAPRHHLRSEADLSRVFGTVPSRTSTS